MRLAILLSLSALFTGCDQSLSYEDIQGNWEIEKSYTTVRDDRQYRLSKFAKTLLGEKFVLYEDGSARFGKHAQNEGEWDFQSENSILSIKHTSGTNFGQMRVIARGDSTLKIAYRVPNTGEIFLILLDQGPLAEENEYEVY